MVRSFSSDPTRPCLWMTAGLVSYRLCDRDFDCEHCPLDAALRGEPRHRASSTVGARYRGDFPDGARYSSGHLWLRTCTDREGVVRLGLDDLAAALLGGCRAVRCAPSGTPVEAGQGVCELDLGSGIVPLASPVPGRVAAGNPLLAESPERILSAPYGDGWLLELECDGPASAAARSATLGADGLLDAQGARERARMDLRRFRRRVALHLLTETRDDTATVGPTLADGGVVIGDLRQMLGERYWLEVLRDLIH